jgi:hypothetical protein
MKGTMGMKKMKHIAAALAFIGAASFGGSTFASVVNPVTWGAPTNITGNSDISTLGTFIAAFNMNGSAVVLNGVSFAPFAITSQTTSATNGNYMILENPGHLLAESGLGSSSAPFSSLSASYQTLLSTAVSSDDNNTITLLMNGLTIGQSYQFQWWLNASSDLGSGSGFRTTASSGNNVTLDDNVTNAQGGVGQYALGTFTAVSSQQAISFFGTDGTQAPTIDAFQLRSIPEPSSIDLLGIAGLLGGATFLVRHRVASSNR